jgi:hypothetical protein
MADPKVEASKTAIYERNRKLGATRFGLRAAFIFPVITVYIKVR